MNAGEKEKGRGGRPRKQQVCSAETHRRRLLILQRVLWRGFAEVADLARKFRCHTHSIELDLSALAEPEEGPPLIKRITKKVVVSLVPVLPSERLAQRLDSNFAAKWAVAKSACNLVSPKDTIFLGGGGTCFLLAYELARRGISGIRVVTKTLYLLQLLKGVSQVKIVGGVLGRDSAVIEWDAEPGSLEAEGINKAFLGVNAVTRKQGASCVWLDVAIQREACLSARDMSVIMADHEEIRQPSNKEIFVTFEELEKRNKKYKVICNKQGLTDEARRELEGFPQGSIDLI